MDAENSNRRGDTRDIYVVSQKLQNRNSLLMKSKRIAIIGASGMLGSDLVTYLNPYFTITAITRENYNSFLDSAFDIVINANGNSRRFWANNNVLEDFTLSTTSVYKSMFDFTYDQYIYISTSDVYPNHASSRYTKETQQIETEKLSPYGLHKYLSEMIVKNQCKNYLILRSSMMLGSKLRKGPLYDVLHRKPLFITKESTLQMITTKEIAQCIYFLTKKKIKNKTFNIGGKGTVSFTDIKKFVDFPVFFSKNAEKQAYEMNVSKFHSLYPMKASKAYLQEFLDHL